MIKSRHRIILMLSLFVACGLALSFDSQTEMRLPTAALRTTTFDCTALDDSKIIISASACGVSNGSIVGMQGTGTGILNFTWFDTHNTIVGTTADLMNVPTGTYHVTLKDDSKCPSVTAFYNIGENNPIRIDNTNVVITQPSCNANNGSITNINVTAATTYQWTDLYNKVVGTSLDLTGVPSGPYVLTASNNTGCIMQSRYVISAGVSAPLMTSFTFGNSDCAATGIFHATFDIKQTDPQYIYTINDQNGKNYFTGELAYSSGVDSVRISIPTPVSQYQVNDNPGLPPGTYTLTTIGGTCFTKLLTFTIGMDTFRVDTSKVKISPNVCGLYTGKINFLSLVNGLPPVVSDPNPAHGYFWTNSKGVRVITNQISLSIVPADTYTLVVVGPDGCKTPPVSFVIPDSVSTASKPILNDVKMCLPGTAYLDVQNKDVNAKYKLYDSAFNLIDSSKAGFFARKVNVTTTFYIQSVNGICDSPLGKVVATVVDPGVNFPNAFTPNNDGINDYWQINGLEEYPGTEITIYNRYGQRVYHSINYANPFDGKYNGKDLPEGVYYYIIDTKKPDCRAGVSGSLTIIR